MLRQLFNTSLDDLNFDISMQIAGRVQCIEWTHSYLIEGNLRSQQYWYFLFSCSLYTKMLAQALVYGNAMENNCNESI